MKPFKFRVFDKTKKEFVSPVEIYTNGYGELMVLNKESLSVEDYYTLPYDKYSITYSTGLFDYHGVEIFEGDILKDNCYETDETSSLKVIYDEARAAFMVEDQNEESDIFDLYEKEFLVAGNIYTNPEIFTGGE